MYYHIRKTINDALSEALKESLGNAMEDAANEAIQDVMEQFVGNILNEKTLAGYCNDIYLDIVQIVHDMMELVFGEIIDMGGEVDD